MKSLMKAAVLLAAFSILPFSMLTSEADAGSRKIKRNKVSLSANLSSPWMLQFKPKRRYATRAALKRARRPKSLRVKRNSSYQKIRITPRSSQTHTASIPKPSNKLRRSIAPAFDDEMLPTVVTYHGSDKPGTIVVNTIERRLYMVLSGGMARRYAIGVGKPGFEWSGTHKISRKAEWPDWRPPAEMIAREKKKGRILPAFMAGGPTNPLGARALYLGSSIYRIHGTTQNWSIGKAVSSGCIRMRNEDVIDLYDRIPVGTRVRVI